MKAGVSPFQNHQNIIDDLISFHSLSHCKCKPTSMGDLGEMGLVASKPVFGVSDKARLKPVSSATGASLKIEIPPVSSLDMTLSKK